MILSVLIPGLLMTGCDGGKEPEVSLFSSEKTVGKDILIGDITDFYYTEENITYNAFYQRYRFYEEEGKHYFFHERREREGDYGWCTEEDTVLKGTVELTAEQWSSFYGFVEGGIVTARKDSADAGDTGPWTYLYWKKDKDKYQEFSFRSYDSEKNFVDYCVSLVQEDGADPSAVETSAKPSENSSFVLEDYTADENILFEYYEATSGTVDGDEYVMFVLYGYSDTELILVRKSGYSGDNDTLDYCFADISLLDDCMALTKKYKMDSKKWKDGNGLRGKEYSVVFLKDGELKKVSSDHMPDNGKEAFDSVYMLLNGAWSDASRDSN